MDVMIIESLNATFHPTGSSALQYQLRFINLSSYSFLYLKIFPVSHWSSKKRMAFSNSGKL